MNSVVALEIIKSALHKIIPKPPLAISPEMFLMNDMGLDSVELLNLLVEIERLSHTRIDLIELIRSRDVQQAYNRDIKIADLMQFLMTVGAGQ